MREPIKVTITFDGGVVSQQFEEGEDFSATMFLSDLAVRDFNLMMQAAMRRVIHEAREAEREAEAVRQ